jgi:hypothetical protein
VSNGAAEIIGSEEPYAFSVTIEGTAPLLFHGYNVESVKEKAAAAKNSKAKKTDDINSYVYRLEDGRLGIPAECFAAAIAHAAKRMQDPVSPRKSAYDLCRASVVPVEMISPLQPDTTEWDYVDIRRVVVQRNAVPRERPAMRAGWRCTFNMQVLAPEYLPPATIRALIVKAGRLSGLLDFRPTYGRFDMVQFEMSHLAM